MKYKNNYTLDIEVAPDRTIFKNKKLDSEVEAFVYSVAIFDLSRDPIAERLDGFRRFLGFSDLFDTFIREDKKQRATYWFLVHNLGYDGIFIIYWALSMGLTEAGDEIKRNEFRVLQKQSTIYKIAINYRNVTFIFEDNYCKNPAKLQKLGELVGYQFTHKGKEDIDYLKPRSTFDVTPEELDYIIDDVASLALIHKKLNTNARLTIGSTAFNDFLTNRSPFKRNAEDDYKLIRWRYNQAFPNALNVKLFGDYYLGGMCDLIDAEPDHVYKTPIHCYDINSMYPFAMLGLMPMGEAMEEAYDPHKDYTRGTFRYFLKIRFHIETIKVNYYVAKHSRDMFDPHTDVIIPELLPIIKSCYTFRKFEVISVYKFASISNLFGPYVSTHYETKKTATDPINRTKAKLLLNSLYGKFAQRTDTYRIHYELIDGLLNTTTEKETIETKAYHPIAITITQKSRVLLFKTIHQLHEAGYKVYYTDTDSIKTDANPETFQKITGNLDQDRIGAWKYEGVATESVFIAPKKYLMMNGDDVIAVGMSGINKMDHDYRMADTTVKSEINIKNYRRGLTLTVGRKKRVKGGILILPTIYTIEN